MLTYSQAAPDKAAAWAATKMGRAVYDSGLPTDIGVKLYDELSKAEAGLVLGEPLHLVYIIMLEHPVKIFGWSHWGKLFGSLPSTHRKASTRSVSNLSFIASLCALLMAAHYVKESKCFCFLFFVFCLFCHCQSLCFSTACPYA